MPFEPLNAPFSEISGLGCRCVIWRSPLVLEIFKYCQSGPPEDIEIAGRKISGTRPVSITKDSRIWRLTFKCPIVMRVRNENIYLTHPERDSLPSSYSFSKDSFWLSELRKEPLFRYPNATHGIFILWDDIVKIISDGLPAIKEIPDDVT
jgi:hypothetical protein